MSISKTKKLSHFLLAAIITISCASCANTPTATVTPSSEGVTSEMVSTVTPTPTMTVAPEADETATPVSPAETSPFSSFTQPWLDLYPYSFISVTSHERIFESKLIGITVELPEKWDGMFEFREEISNQSHAHNFTSLSIYTKPQPIPDNIENLHTNWIAGFVRYRKDIWERTMAPGNEIVATEMPRCVVAEDENSIVVLSYPRDVQYDIQNAEIAERYSTVEEGLRNGEYKVQIDKSIPD